MNNIIRGELINDKLYILGGYGDVIYGINIFTIYFGLNTVIKRKEEINIYKTEKINISIYFIQKKIFKKWDVHGH